MNNFFKFLGLLFAILFMYAAVVQFNDPDALFWVFVYAIGAIVSLLFAFQKLHFIVPTLLFLFYAGLAVYYWPEEFEGVALQQGMKTVNIEKGRESLGSAMGAVMMLIYALRLRLKK